MEGQRTKATFKALRETVGLSQDNVAKDLGVSVTSVKRWERPGYQYPPADAWEYMLDAYRAHCDAVNGALEQVDEIADLVGHDPELVPITYWRTQEQYDRAGRDPGYVGVVNACARAVGDELLKQGIEVEWRFPEEGAVSTPGSRY